MGGCTQACMCDSVHTGTRGWLWGAGSLLLPWLQASNLGYLA